MAQSRFYSSTARKTALAQQVDSSATTIVVNQAQGFPATFPFTLIIDRDTIDEEVVECTAAAGSTLTVTRGVDGTTPVAHAVGAQVEHGVSARDFRESRQHEAASTNVHGLGMGVSVVGTTTAQTLSNKTLGSDLAAGGFKVTGLADPTNAQDAATKNWSETAMTSQLNQATTQATNAAASASAAATSESNASDSETAAATSETNAAASETAAAASEAAALASQTAAATSETAADASEAAALASQTAAATSESNAASSATAASGSASAAAASQSAAATSASNAATSESNAATSETNAAASSAAALASESAAAASESAAAASESAADTSESNAAASASASAASASAASASQSAAAASESAAATSASNAATSETNAAASAVSASNSAAAAAASLDSFDDRYLGAKASFPTVDNDGDPLLQGALFYLNTGTAEQIGMYVYDGGTWIKASAASVASIVTYEYTATSGQTAFTGNDDNGVALSFTAGLLQVFLNGVLLSPGDDYTTSTNTVTLASGAAASDVLVVVAFASFNVANTYTISQADALFATKTELTSVEALALLGL
jgi:hypothetical protein